MRRWSLLSTAIVSEVSGSLSLKAALDEPLFYIVVACGYVASFVFLAAALRAGMALGVAYGIWGALGVASTALLSWQLFDEPLTRLMILGLALVIVGVLTLEFGSHAAGARTATPSPSSDPG